MTNQKMYEELDSNPLVMSLIEKTRAGRLNWEATADERTFIASVGGETTLKMTMKSAPNPSNYGVDEDVPVLCLIDSQGRTFDEIYSSRVNTGLWLLYRLARRVGNRLDERHANLMEVVEKL